MLKRLDLDESELVETDDRLPPVQNDSEPKASDNEASEFIIEEKESWLDTETMAFLSSMIVHVGLIVGLAAVSISTHPDLIKTLLIKSEPPMLVEPDFNILEDLASVDAISDAIGNNSIGETASRFKPRPRSF